MKRILLIVAITALLALSFAACNGPAPVQDQSLSSGTSTPVPTVLLAASQTDTAILEVSAPPSSTQTRVEDTLTPTPPSSPTVAATQTQAQGTLDATAALAATVAAYQNTESALLGPMADLLMINQYFDPVGTPLASWHDIPVMTEATAGQEFKADIYSYKAAATLSVASQFYNSQTSALGWSCFPNGTGSAGTGSNANHSISMTCQGFRIIMTSMDNDLSHVIVVINKAP